MSIQQRIPEAVADWLREAYEDDLAELALGYPQDTRSLVLDHAEIYKHDEAWGDDWIDDPDGMRSQFEEALSLVDIPADIDLSEAHIRIRNLHDADTYYPGTFSPAEKVGELLCVRGEVSKATDLEPVIDEGAHECQRCGTFTYIPDGQTPNQCQGCERKGPFQLNEDESDFTDRQKARIKTPPDQSDAAGSFIDGLLFDDIAGTVSVGDRIKATGILRFEEDERDGELVLDPYLKILYAEPEERNDTNLTVTDEDREAIQAVLDDPEHDSLDVAANSLHHGIYGHHEAKKGLILAAIGGDKVDSDRGDIHLLMIGSPSTGKSELGDQLAELVTHSVDAQAAFSTGVGLTASCVRNDDFGDGGWTIEAGAFVKANGGLLWIDELDDLATEDLKSLNNPMDKQQITVRKADVEAEFATEATVVAAANPEDTSFNPYEDLAPQFGFGDDLMARFDLIYTFHDTQDERHDGNVAKQALSHNYAKKTDADVSSVAPKPNISQDLLQKWIHDASQREVTWENESVLDEAVEAYTQLRKQYASEEGQSKRVTARNIGGLRRACEAVAKFHFSDVVTSEHVSIAVERVRASLADLNQSGSDNGEHTQFADVHSVKGIIRDLQNGDGANLETVYERAEDAGIEREKAEHRIQKLKDQGQAMNPDNGTVRLV